VTGRNKTLRDAVDARLEVHRGLGPETSQNADGLHGLPSNHRRRVLAAGRDFRLVDNRARANSDELPPGQPINHVNTLPFARFDRAGLRLKIPDVYKTREFREKGCPFS
jgi:hypothetical protein